MALPTPPPSTNPIPNDPFYYPDTNYIRGEYGPFIVGSGLNINNNTGVISVTAGAGGVASVIAGPGISVSGSTGNVTINNAGVRQLAVGPGLSASAATGNVTISFASTPVFPSDFPATGSLLAGSGVGTFSALPVGTNGKFLLACSTEATGVCWGPGAATPTQYGTVYAETLDAAGCLSTSLGFCAMNSLSTGTSNTLVGSSAGQNVTTGSNNTALGANALLLTTSGGCNTAVGQNALRSNTSTFNVAVGNNALCCNTSGSQNIAVGAAAMALTTTGSFNTAIGTSALVRNTTGCSNVGIGIGALCNLTTGSGNLVFAGTTGIGGYSPVFDVTTQDNRIGLGSTAVTDAYVQVNWTITSDARDKIVQGGVPHGLDFVKQLEPKAFYFKETRDSTEPHGPLRYGFLAQDILALEGEGSVIIDNENPDKLRYKGESLVPVLVNAIKELSDKFDALEAKLNGHG